tara:strand:- start:248 stop:1057 length:810 start_codon:yes stop_codon:yes gene_type:complete
MAFKTLSYSQSTEGWPSFYSFNPEYMIGMNNFFYSFSGGNLFRHNSSAVPRMEFYGIQGSGTMQTVLNNMPLESKVFKTISLESDNPWNITAFTDVNPNVTQTIDSTFFEQKEGAWFTYLRYTDVVAPDPFTAEYPLRSINGIGKSDNITGPVGVSLIQFPEGTEVNSILSVGDKMYFSQVISGYQTLQLMGTVILINRNLRQVTVDATAGTVPVVVVGGADAFFAYMKNQVAESYGALGHYLIINLTASTTSATELFAIESQIFKSNP